MFWQLIQVDYAVNVYIKGFSNIQQKNLPSSMTGSDYHWFKSVMLSFLS